MKYKNYQNNQILPFNINTKMVDLIHIDYRLLPVIGRFGIDFGFGNKTIREVCDFHNVNVYFFLEIVNTYHNSTYFPENHLKDYSVLQIIQYLSSTHHYYLSHKVPEIEQYITELEKQASPFNLRNIQLLKHFFKGYKGELTKHLDREEKEVFPYVIMLEKATSNNDYNNTLRDLIKQKTIEKYEESHDSIDVKLNDLKSLIIRYLPPVLNRELCQKLLTELFRLENDIQIHSQIEDSVLIPQVKILEQKILASSGAN